jgi:AcrR family transcriptional regulator
MRPKAKKNTEVGVRDPARTRHRILQAALAEFSARGFAGARIGGVARRAKVNKRMLYHYFGDKEGLFRAVLRHKISNRLNQVEVQVPQGDKVSNLAQWFQQNCQDTDWVRLLAWESLQVTKGPALDETERRRFARRAIARIRQKQAAGSLRSDVAAAHLQLAKISLSMFPLAMPQLVRIIIGRSPHDPKFQREYARFLETISSAFRPEYRGVEIKFVRPKKA